MRVTYYTDPACPWSWAAEPARRELQVEFGAGLAFTYVMGGLAREFRRPVDTLRAWLDAGARGGMPLDPRLWLEDPPRSSYPACLAVKAAAEQGLEAPYLRRVSEGLACERRRLDSSEALIDLARQIEGLDLERFRVDLDSNAILEAFGADLQRARAAAPDRHDEHGRVPFPSLEFQGADGAVHGVYGEGEVGAYRAAAVAAGAQPVAESRPGVEEALARFGRLATAEIAAVCDLRGPRAAAELWRLASEWRVAPRRCLVGELWQLAHGPT